MTNEIFAKVVVSILASADPALLSAGAARGAHGTDARTHGGEDGTRRLLATVLSADYALNHLDADLRWMTTTAARLTTLTAEVDTA